MSMSLFVCLSVFAKENCLHECNTYELVSISVFPFISLKIRKMYFSENFSGKMWPILANATVSIFELFDNL